MGPCCRQIMELVVTVLALRLIAIIGVLFLGRKCSFDLVICSREHPCREWDIRFKKSIIKKMVPVNYWKTITCEDSLNANKNIMITDIQISGEGENLGFFIFQIVSI